MSTPPVVVDPYLESTQRRYWLFSEHELREAPVRQASRGLPAGKPAQSIARWCKLAHAPQS